MVDVNKIYAMDCVAGMQQYLSDNSVDCVFTSPPYNLGRSYRGGEVVKIYDLYDDDLSQEEYYLFIKRVLAELLRVTKYYVFFNFQMLTNNKKAYLQIMGDFKDNIKDVIIWNKKQCEPSIQPTCLSSKFEFIVVFAKKEYCTKRSFERANFNNRIKEKILYNVWEGNSASAKELNTIYSSNKAVFPQYLVREFIKNFTREGDIVLDPFMGTGTTAVVCKHERRNYIGFEIEENLIKIAEERLKQANLFNFSEDGEV